MVQNATYSFLDVQCAVTGPGGQFSISEGGIAEEGITIEYEGSRYRDVRHAPLERRPLIATGVASLIDLVHAPDLPGDRR